MHGLIACSTFAMAVTLAVRRPRIAGRVEVTPAGAAIAATLPLLLLGTVTPDDLLFAVDTLWRPLLTILAIMVTTACARHVGLIDVIAQVVLARRAASARMLYGRVFLLSVVTASLLSNDAAILLLTPLVLGFVGRRYPDRPELRLPFAFAVFMAAGVAPLVISNPMNLVVASYAGFGFNEYAVTMLPVALAGSVITFVLLRRIFKAELAMDAPAAPTAGAVRFTRRQIALLALLAVVTLSYPVVAALGGTAVWPVATAGALAALAVASWRGPTGPATLVRSVSWDVLVFLPAVFVLTIGLRNAGLVELLAAWYADAGLAVVGVTSAVGSAVLNNHPMALVNMLALDPAPDGQRLHFLAALVGGDLGPRLLPTGSLAGLLWVESCRGLDVAVSPRDFVRVGAALTIPTLAVSLAMLAAW